MSAILHRAPAARETILTHARLILPDQELDGTLVLRDGVIADVQPGRAHHPSAVDCGGEVLMPGVVDVHTDNLERQVMPRSNARWPSRSAFLSHDAQCAVAGVTTVLDALCLGDLGFDVERGKTFEDGVRDITALTAEGVLKVEHLLHLRCELPAADMPTLLDPVAEHPLVAMVSLMDHSPGVGQYRDLVRYRAMRLKTTRMTEAQIETRIAELLEQRARLREPQRRMVLDRFAGRDVPLASHDDEVPAEVARNAADGIMVSEFPVTMEAAREAARLGVAVIAGAPNIVRGGSHSGNVAAMDLVRAGAVDVLASDYVPPALIEAAFAMAEVTGLPAAIATITANAADMCRLQDRGRLAIGQRADIVRVLPHQGIPVIRAVWRGGERVA
ncbi:alpha-D-ribose 1-methylphosphonate 5-triphosphate diphosphatase [Roseococcus suduntuyensis]|uniref:Alpha-D-ribose 1-methylphosphonate 5-triphosphate diphosphatase n=1 Tax=Roseococcus suduntuyensis TaxID=455361 RepID=A0A840AAH2_9PROT|nr:alpha-D-ribose 1-methylphosphonate 5-triphosphate diphosphatase [Roseococcus suduntuyensis]MBB3897892.1 alpha-D-ribose 1-methylphosphonate 5-triphosphate diphosphatase [Roseococcus suduntuyensis]